MISIKKIKKQTIFTILLLKYLKMLTVSLNEERNTESIGLTVTLVSVVMLVLNYSTTAIVILFEPYRNCKK